jgi:multiple sugar transport system ATP-binding protein
MAQVDLTNICKTFAGAEDTPAVRDVNFAAEDGEFLVLVGPSGCGKSTTLRMVAGLEEPDSGEIRIGDRVVNDVEPKDRDIAMVFQNYALYPHMTVFKNMAFGLKLRKYPKAEIKQRVEDAADILGIEHLLERKPRALSGGERQRVAVGRAIVRHPQVFLFDEPLSNLDAKLRVQMRAEISKLHARLKTTMIYVTHDQVEAMTMGDRIVVMLDGEIQQIAPPLELYNNPANRFVAEFIGSPPMNIIEGGLEQADGALSFKSGGGGLSMAVHDSHREALSQHAGKPVVCGLRPEALSNDGSNGGCTLKAVAEVVEPMGAETFVYLNLDGKTVAARIENHERPTVSEPYTVAIANDQAHYFDADSGAPLIGGA